MPKPDGYRVPPEWLSPLTHPLIALLVVRGLPTIVFRGDADARQLAGGGLLQATLLPIAPTQIGLELGLLSPATGAALIVAGLVSVLIFPTLALALLRRPSTAGYAALPGSPRPNASTMLAIVDAVPIVMQWPCERCMHDSAS